MGGLMSSCKRREKVTWKVFNGNADMKVYRREGSPSWTCKTCNAVWTRVWDIKRGTALLSIGSSASGSTVGSVEILDSESQVSGDRKSMSLSLDEVQSSEDSPTLQTWLVTAGKVTHEWGGDMYYCPDCTSTWVPEHPEVTPKKKN